ncbi:hypothetical protein DM558_06165 [Entomomonas moraniae]|uniref:AntA/AntB antirepressor domain-containing protein n=1 Tax=Entomomonas moraniae TaxID=2213226 RepID=A0A3S9XD88_9GAMM|nr:antA/AntB antirepressor family protein [Entomomonas moraniae]AZS50384.1 hypothetical protein DM558_06165 [Entomomonas moraniae]
MNELIKIEQSKINNELVKTVNARTLYEFLEVETQFKDWIARRISEYGFIENTDYLSFAQKRAKPTGGRPSVEYHITIDMAKELSMVERNEKGRLARKYFIECEKIVLGESKQIKTDNSGLVQFRQARALKMATESAKDICLMFPSLSEKSKQVIYAGLVNPIAGAEIIPLPKLEQKLYTAEDIGKILNISANKVGRIANSLGIKTQENGENILTKSKYSAKQVPNFMYNDKGLEAIRLALAEAS